MKKKCFTFMRAMALSVVLLSAGTSNAANEFILENADDVTSSEWPDWSWNGTATKVTNPLSNSTNSSANVWKFNAPATWAGFSIGNDAGLGIDFATYSTFQCLVYCPDAPVAGIKLLIAALEGATGEVDLGFVKCSDGWAVVTGDVSAWTGNCTKFAIKNGDNTGGLDIYFDDIKFVDPSGIPSKVIDNAETVTSAWDWSWGGCEYAKTADLKVANPKSDAVNSTGKVLKVTPTAEWGGLSFGVNGTTIAAEYDFTKYSRFEMLVYCPAVAELQLIIGIEDADGGANFEINQACATGWVKITQDVSAWTGNSSTKFFIKNGNGTANVDIYLDEIQFVDPDATTSVKELNVADTSAFYNDGNIVVTAPENFTYVLYNTLGTLIAKGMAVGSTSVDAQNLPAGVYIVKINAAGKTVSKKINVN